MLIWGYRQKAIDLGAVGTKHCPNCGQDRPFRNSLSYQYSHLYYIFGFVSSKRYMTCCSICGEGTPIDAASAEARLGKNPIPFWDRYGLLSAFGGGLALVLFAVVLRATGPEIRNIPDLTDRVKRGDVTAVAQLRREAEHGDLPSQLALGGLLAGEGNTRFLNLEEAFRWALAAAKQGSTAAAYAVARRYEAGQGTQVNPVEAMHWYRVAADRGYVTAENSIGALYARGIGVTADPKEAVRWFRKAAEAGDTAADFNLAMSYLSGSGVEDASPDKNAAEAVVLLEKAAKPKAQDETSKMVAADAQNHLGKLYEEGRGVKKDALKALNYYQSASSINAEAKASVERLKARLQANTSR